MTTKGFDDASIKRRDFLKLPAIAGAGLILPTACDDSPVENGTGQTADDSKSYEKLADALDKLPNGFPRTRSKVEIALLKKIFLPEEAWLAAQLTGTAEPVADIAERVGLPVEETATRLSAMIDRGFVLGDAEQGYFRLAPFVVGFYEAQLEVMDHEMAHLFEEYLGQGGYNLMQYQPSLHRVIPSQSALKTEWILPYDKLIELMNSCNTFRVNDCICRKQQELTGGKRCNFPLHVELVFYTGEESTEPPVAPFVTKEEALAVLNQTEEIGLVHTVSNAAEGVYYVCNCCGCCCAILRGITDFGIAKSVAAANYYAVIDPALCKGCGNCVKRCQVRATSLRDNVSIVDRPACIGCGLCATGCPSKAAHLEPKPPSERVEPPKDFATWEHERLVSRGME